MEPPRIGLVRTRKILTGICVREREKRLGFVSGQNCRDGSGVDDEASDVGLAVENMDESGESKDDEQGVAADHSHGRDEEEKRGDNFSAAENRAD